MHLDDCIFEKVTQAGLYWSLNRGPVLIAYELNFNLLPIMAGVLMFTAMVCLGYYYYLKA